MIAVRRAHPADAASIAAVHVAAWRSAYPRILPATYLAHLSGIRQAIYYEQAIREQDGVFVATVSGRDLPVGAAAGVVGFTTCAPARAQGIADGEIETLYVLDDWRERGLGRRLMHVAARHLDRIGCRSAFLWVLSENPSRWFYSRLDGKPVVQTMIAVAGRRVPATAFLWDPIERLLVASATAR